MDEQIEARLREYLDFSRKYPHLFYNDEDINSLKVILDYDVIAVQQQILYDKADKKNTPHHFYDIGILAQDNWTITIRDLVQFPNGGYGGYIRMLNKNSSVYLSGKDIVILPVISKTKILLIRHFRHESRKWCWEIPRGFGEQGLSPEKNAEKELMEETGLYPDEIEIIGGENSSVVYAAAYISDIENKLVFEYDEGISEKRVVTGSDFKAMILSGEVEDSYTITASAYAMIKGIM